ncbi:MAG: alpha-amylase family glycosyl hydrolase, partial [Syntrophothermus sp.]
MDNKNVIKYDFHVLKDSRIKFNIEDSLFSLVGDLIVSNFNQARILAKKINDIRVKEGKVDQQVTGSQINALGVLHEIFHFIIRKYEQDHNPNVFTKGIDYIKQHINEDEVEQILLEYTNLFPPMDVYKGRLTAQEYLNSKTGNKPNNEIILEEVIILHLENINPAVVQLQELFSDKELHSKTRYIELISHIESFFESEVPFGGERISLISFLKKPIVSSPFDIDKQLEYILKNWTGYVSDFITQRLLKSRDFIQEDAKMFAFKGGFVKSTPQVPDFSEDEYFNKLKAKLAAGKKLTEAEQKYYMSEVEQFTEDIDWMPKVVMLAKNAYVWLFQLSQKYQREIKRLDQIPDEELDQLARWNFTSLWLIGIWERSSASKKIKQIMGNPEATSSAYSLFDYVIANDLGGEDAFQNLKLRAAARNIKLASDMVPNHTGIYSKWVVEKPEYFIQSDYPPFPGYTFNSADLSDDPRVEVRIEDKYYSRSDAAVVFQRRDKHTGDVKYFYHGNDGTQMPWNDTSQLNLLNPEVRESLIQTIMHVARKTPIIRFDAAMTLTKKHYQRLWFPIPGTGGDIPSRADYAMTRDAFDAAMPNEFWREV